MSTDRHWSRQGTVIVSESRAVESVMSVSLLVISCSRQVLKQPLVNYEFSQTYPNLAKEKSSSDHLSGMWRAVSHILACPLCISWFLQPGTPALSVLDHNVILQHYSIKLLLRWNNLSLTATFRCLTSWEWSLIISVYFVALTQRIEFRYIISQTQTHTNKDVCPCAHDKRLLTMKQ